MTWDGDALRWVIETCSGTLTADVVVSATGPLSDPQDPGHPRARHRSPARSSTPRAGTTTTTCAASVSPWSAPGPRPSRSCPRSSRTSRGSPLFQRTPPWVMPRVDRADQRRPSAGCTGSCRSPRTPRRGLLWGAGSCRSRRSPSAPTSSGRRAARQAQHGEGRQGPRAAGQADPLLPHRLQAHPAVQHVLPGARPAQCGRGRLGPGRDPRVDRSSPPTAARPRSTRSSSGPASTSPTCRSPSGSSGAEGITLAEAWKAGMKSLRGATAAGFPNWMTIIGPNTGLGNSSMILMIESQLNYMADYVRAVGRASAAAPGWRSTRGPARAAPGTTASRSG